MLLIIKRKNWYALKKTDMLWYHWKKQDLLYVADAIFGKKKLDIETSAMLEIAKHAEDPVLICGVCIQDVQRGIGGCHYACMNTGGAAWLRNRFSLSYSSCAGWGKCPGWTVCTVRDPRSDRIRIRTSENPNPHWILQYRFPNIGKKTLWRLCCQPWF